jgi:hypothetical protein
MALFGVRRRFLMSRVRIAIAVLVLASPGVSAEAQPKANDVQPDHLPLGTVYTGAIVQGSFLVFEMGKNPDLPFSVTAPKFITVRHKAARHQEYGAGNDFICGSVEFTLDTSVAGELSGEFRVILGNAAVKVPISATVKPVKAGLPRLLIVETPFERYSTRHGEHFKAWTDLVKEASLDVNYLLTIPGKPVLGDLDLGKFDAVLLASTGLTELQAADVKRAREFAEAGGRVVVAANAFFRGTVEKANAVLDKYGIQIRDEEAHPGRNAVTVEKDDLDPSLVTAGVRSARFFRASPVAMTDARAGCVLVKAVGVGRPGDGFVAAAKAGKGEVIALGQSLWWNWITDEQAAGADNARLLRRLLVLRKAK